MEKKTWSRPEMQIQVFRANEYVCVCEDVTITQQNCLGPGAVFNAGSDGFTWRDLLGFIWNNSAETHNCNGGHTVKIENPEKSDWVFFKSDKDGGNGSTASGLFNDLQSQAGGMTDSELDQEVTGNGSNWWWVAQPEGGWADNSINHGHYMSYTRAYNHS